MTLELMLDVLQIPLMIPSELPEEDDSSTPYVNEAAIGGDGERSRRHGSCRVPTIQDTPYVNEASHRGWNRRCSHSIRRRERVRVY